MFVAMLVLMPALALGQETREATIAAEQRDKAARLVPYESHWAEQLLLTVEELVEQPSGFYPYFDSVYAAGASRSARGAPVHRGS